MNAPLRLPYCNICGSARTCICQSYNQNNTTAYYEVNKVAEKIKQIERLLDEIRKEMKI